MNYKITAFAVMIAVVGLFSSCLKSDSDTTTYNDALISSFSLGNVKCTRTIHKSDGTDSTYTYSYAASSYPMSIDQVNSKIFNATPLVVNTKVDKVLTTISTMNSGTVLLKSVSDDTFTLFDSSDSLDYTSDRVFRVVSNDGLVHRDYTVHVNISSYAENSVTWDGVKTYTMGQMYNGIAATAFCDNQLYMLVTTPSGKAVYSTADGSSWEAKAMAPGTVAGDSVIVAANMKLYMLANGTLYESSDKAVSWTKTNNAPTIKTLIGGDDYCLHALNANNQFVSLNLYDTKFSVDSLESEQYNKVSNYLPYKDVNFMSTSVKTNSDITRYVVIANGDPAKCGNDTTAVIWNRIADSLEVQPWTLTTFNWKNHYHALPNMQGLTAAYMNEGIFAMGGKSTHRLFKDVTPFSTLYYSPDFGATWSTSSDITLPSDYTTDNVKSVKLLAYGNNMYLIALVNATGQSSVVKMWKATLNKTNNTYYYE